MSMPGIVHFRLPDGPNTGATRNAIVTQVISNTVYNLAVFVDPSDYPEATGGATASGHLQLFPLSFTSVPQGHSHDGVFPLGTWFN